MKKQKQKKNNKDRNEIEKMKLREKKKTKTKKNCMKIKMSTISREIKMILKYNTNLLILNSNTNMKDNKRISKKNYMTIRQICSSLQIRILILHKLDAF